MNPKDFTCLFKRELVVNLEKIKQSIEIMEINMEQHIDWNKLWFYDPALYNYLKQVYDELNHLAYHYENLINLLKTIQEYYSEEDAKELIPTK